MPPLLRYEIAASDIYSKLKDIPRTGWVIRDVTNPETVYDHTVSLVKLAQEMQVDLALTDEQLDDLTHILEIHDWAEALAGDEYVENEDQASYKEKKRLKAIREREALQQLLQHKPCKAVVETLFNRYEEGSGEIAKLAKELDKYQALELALQYEQEQGIPLFTEFDDYYKRDWPFSHPAILERIHNLRTQHTNTK